MKIESSVLWNNRSGENVSWFHPRCCKTGDGKIFMSLQSIGGSDYYGPLHESISEGDCWSTPRPIPGLGWQKREDGIAEGVCDVVPYWHAPTDTVLAIGHNVYYRDGALFDSLGDFRTENGPVLRRFPVWSIRRADGSWSAVRQKLDFPDSETYSVYTCGCSQWFFRGEDELVLPLSHGFFGRRDRMVCTARFRYDGKTIVFVEKGNTLELPVGRGLLEPSLVDRNDRVLMTLRAEDGCGYVTESPDGLHWGALRPWQFDDGEVLAMSTTQQHFLFCGGKLHLVYMRNAGYNAHVMRFRAPLFIAEVNEDLHLIKASEQIVFPMIPEGDHAPGLGNFQAVAVSDREAIITVGEERNYDHCFGNTLLARITF